jgi:uncharacterized glyoxalase superfamily protein PhnB
MLQNRSVPTNILLPHIVYQDVAAAIQWLSAAFGFVEHYRYGDSSGAVNGAQMHLGDAWIMLRQSRKGESPPRQLGAATQSLTVFIEDVESHFKHSKAAGAKIIEELNETFYGEFQYGVEDLDSHHWLFSRHARDVSPDKWGARLVSS